MGRRGAVAVAVALVLMTSGQADAHPGSRRQQECGVEWGSLRKATPPARSGPLVDARAGRHACFDRLVLDIAGGPLPGYEISYTDGVSGIGSGEELAVGGGATLTIVVTAPGRDALVNPTVPWRAGTDIMSEGELAAAGFRTLRNLVYGGSLEGRSVVGLGVRARLPFRVLRLDGPGAANRVVIDVAHAW